MRSRLALLALSILALALPASALAAPEQEPNDGIHEAQGPAVAGTTYDGAISSSNDVDTYIVYVSGQGLLNVQTTNTDDPDECSVTTRLRDQDGESLNSVSIGNDQAESIPYNTPGAGVYYVTVRGGCPPDDYQLVVTGPVGTGPAPGPAQPTPNGHTGLASAFGPLAGGTLYGASIDANNEEDWFFLYTAGAGTFDVAVTNIADPDECSVSTRLLDQGGSSLNSISTGDDRIGHIPYTAAGPAKFVLQFRGGCPVDRYQFRIDPAGLLTATPPPAPPVVAPKTVTAACKLARTKRTKAKKRVKAAKKKVGAARRPAARRKAKRVLKKRKTGLRKAKARAKQRCA